MDGHLLRNYLVSLNVKRKALESEMKRLVQADDEEWKRISSDMESSLQELEATVDSVAARLKL